MMLFLLLAAACAPLALIFSISSAPVLANDCARRSREAEGYSGEARESTRRDIGARPYHAGRSYPPTLAADERISTGGETWPGSNTDYGEHSLKSHLPSDASDGNAVSLRRTGLAPHSTLEARSARRMLYAVNQILK
jgi:hypothetical protein